MLTKPSDSSSEDGFEELLAQLGGAKALKDDPNDFRKAVNRLWAERYLLADTHSNRWVSMGKVGVVSVGDSIEDVVAATEAKGISTADVIAEHLGSEPERLILLSAVA